MARTKVKGSFGLYNPASVNVKDYGAKGDGSTDDSAAIQAAIDAAGAGLVLFPPGDYCIKSNLILRGCIKGVPGATIIRIAADFSHAVAGSPFSYTAIWNAACNESGYVEANADYIGIEGIKFIRDATSTAILDIFSLANVKGGYLRDCVLTHDMVNSKHTLSNLNLHACVKNFEVANNRMYNLTTAVSGGHIWVRNINYNYADKDATENIVIRDNYFEKDSGDESLAIFGSKHIVRNVDVARNVFKASGTAQGTLIAVFPLSDSGANANVAVANVTIRDNRITTTSTTGNVIRTSEGTDSGFLCDNIEIANNKIKAQVDATGSSYLIRNVFGTNVRAIGNIAELTNAVNYSYGIHACQIAHSNVIVGNGFDNGAISSCDDVRSNTVKTLAGIGIRSCKEVHFNYVEGRTCFQVFATIDSRVSNNTFKTLASITDSINCVHVSSTGNGSLWFTHNTMDVGHANHRSILLQGTGYKEVRFNRHIGTGKVGSGAANRVGGNQWLSAYNDEGHTSAFTGELMSGAFIPDGHFLRKIDAVPSGGKIHIGWIKVSGAWQAVYGTDT